MPIFDVSHSVMYHHFHGGAHPISQGSIGADVFEDMLKWLGERYNLVGAPVYAERALNGTLSKSDVCISFDDALLCQYDIAAPVLAKRKLEAFFFVYSSPFLGSPDPLEIFRYFRTVQYEHVEEFYSEFSDLIKADPAYDFDSLYSEFRRSGHLQRFAFYSEEDRFFRYLRDVVLKRAKYYKFMFSMIENAGFDHRNIAEKLFMTRDILKKLDSDGHVIGLHSHSHPTAMHELSLEEQLDEYSRNQEFIREVLGVRPINAMSHPCGNYNSDTLSVLRDLGVDLGFRSNMQVKQALSPLEIPREDHANVLKDMVG